MRDDEFAEWSKFGSLGYNDTNLYDFDNVIEILGEKYQIESIL
jgi:hypothetical protein